MFFCIFMEKMQCFETGVDERDACTCLIRPCNPSLKKQRLNAVGTGHSTTNFDNLVADWRKRGRQRKRKKNPTGAKIQNLDCAILLTGYGALPHKENRVTRKSTIFPAWRRGVYSILKIANHRLFIQIYHNVINHTSIDMLILI